MGIVLLNPLFPRGEKYWWEYTHALDRDTLLTRAPEIERLDLQVLDMVKDLMGELKKRNISCADKIWLSGFSAAGMFANRFALLHPEKVEAAAIGSPGGWPIAPAKTYKGQRLRYPVGIADFYSILGREFNAQSFKQVKFLFYLGSKDTNDSVTFDDGYDQKDESLIFKLFGPTPVSRWQKSEVLYLKAGCDCRFKLLNGEGHTIDRDVEKIIVDFFRSVSSQISQN